MNRKILAKLMADERLHDREAIVVALSGGADSVCLAHLLWGMREELGMEVMACHLNHRIRGEEAQRDEDFVRTFCARLGLRLFVKDVDVVSKAKEQGVSLELCGRNERYAFFSSLAKEHRAWIATAHTLSDCMETTLFHLARGTGLRGLCGIPQRRAEIIRPLLPFTREEVEAYCREQNLSYVTDSTNGSDDYTRNFIRHHLIPGLYEVHPGFAKTFAETQRLLLQDEAYLEERAREAVEGARLSKADAGGEETGPGGFNAGKLASLPPAVRGRAIRLLLAQGGIGCSGKQLALIEGMLSTGGAVELSAGCFCRVRKGVLRVKRVLPPAARVNLPVRDGSFPFLDGKTLRMEILDRENWEYLKKFHQKVLKNTLDYDKISVTARIRNRAPGDSIRIMGRGVTKTLKKLLAEAGIEADQRDRIPVLADDNKVLWVYGFGCDASVAAGEETRRILWLQLEEQENGEDLT